ncbi:hypothetical protein [uncultured Enterovirga sp.]|uniref:hypothetical protein n=1 Tax=uncultured Enterovirga sp. TaxID=2026352 RepID=UPI0035CA6597
MSIDGRRDHVVVLGDSRFATSLAAQQSASSELVHAGVESMPGSADGPVQEVTLLRDPDALLHAVGARNARLVVVDLADDAATLAVVAALAVSSDGRAGPEIVAHMRDPSFRRIVDDNLQAKRLSPRPRIVSTAALAASAAIATARPWALAEERGQDRVHAVLLGFTSLGRECLEELILAGIVGSLGKPRVTIIDADPLAVRRILDRDMPEIEVSADLDVASYDPLTLTGPTGPLAVAAGAAPVTLIVIALADPASAMTSMISISRMQEWEGQAVAAALVVTEGQRAVLDLVRPKGRPRDRGRSWTVLGGIDEDPDVLDLVTRRADSLAEKMHDKYCEAFPGDGPACQPWSRLPETYRKANRSAATHLPVKLWSLGLRETGESSNPFAVDPHTYENVIRPIATGRSEDALLRRLSRLEHDRWCAERRLDGWRFGEVRDNERRIHDKLIPFDDPRFTDVDIEKDADQVRFLFGNVVVAAPDGAVTPLVIGVVASPETSGGIAVPAAVSLCRKEPWRPIVVLSALLDPIECSLARDLAAELDGADLSWRLLVPEISLDNREIRSIASAEDKAVLASLLDRPTTRFASIGGIVAPADLWADPSAPDPHAERISAYITTRASAVIVGMDPVVASAADTAG